MNKKLVNQISALLLSSAVALGSQAGMTSMVRAADYVQTGNAGSYRYEVWSQNGYELGNTVFDPDDIYSCSFSGYENVMYRCFRDFSKSRKLTQDYGKITVSYDIDFNIKKGTYQDLTNFYIATYGWTYMPDDDSSANEFYVVDGWGDWRPPGATELDSVEIDGEIYDIYRTIRVNQPGIHSVETYCTFWSVRRNNITEEKLSGNAKNTVTLSEHFKVWEKFGFESAAIHDAGPLVEGYRSGDLMVKMNSFAIETEFYSLPDEKENAGEVKEPETKLPEEDAKEPETKLPEEGTKNPETKLPESDAKVPDAESTDISVLKGDCDNNGTINTADLLVMKKYLLGSSASEISGDSLDIDGNGKVNIADCNHLMNMLLE